MNLLSPGYAFASAYLKGEESKVITAEHIDAMLQKFSIQDALEIIKNTDVGHYLWERPVSNFNEVDIYLWMYFGERLEHLKWLNLPADMVRILSVYVVKYDVSNIKVALRSVLTDKKAPMVPAGVIHNHGLLEQLSSARTLDDVVAIVTICGLDDYAYILKEYEQRTDGDVRARLLTEIRLDNQYYENMLKVMRKGYDRFLLSKSLGVIIDLTNLQLAFRSVIEGIGPAAGEFVLNGGYMLSADAIKELLPLRLSEIVGRLEHTEYHEAAEEISRGYERDGNVTVVDEVIERHKFRLFKESLSPRVLSPSIMVWYLILKEFEIRDLRLALKALIDGVPATEIKDYLVIAS